jgi:Plasmid pRiA4b ORF-3-like protein
MATRAESIRKRMIHRLKVTLREVHPPIWRTIEVPSSIKLSELARVLEEAMGWHGGHLHAYMSGDVTYEIPDDEIVAFGKTVDERTVRLAQVMPFADSKMRWDYDFGDGWEHDVIVDAIGVRRSDVTYPLCVAGMRACPPDDCGGVWGYSNVLAALSDPEHPEHGDVVGWLPPGFDPAAFDVGETTERMRSAELRPGW